MPSDTKARPQRPPEKKIGPFAGGIGVAIWLNEVEAEDGTIQRFRSVTINPRRYLDAKSGQWKDAASYRQSDLPALIFGLEQALAHCFSQPIPGQEVAEAAGLDKVFKDFGAEWRFAGCLMCLGMNPDQLAPGERCASTSNRNFEGRQGKGGRTHLVSPQMAAAAAIAGHFVDIRTWR